MSIKDTIEHLERMQNELFADYEKRIAALKADNARLREAGLGLIRCIPTTADCSLMVRHCQRGGERAAQLADELVEQYRGIDPAVSQMRAALGTEPPK